MAFIYSACRVRAKKMEDKHQRDDKIRDEIASISLPRKSGGYARHEGVEGFSSAYKYIHQEIHPEGGTARGEELTHAHIHRTTPPAPIHCHLTHTSIHQTTQQSIHPQPTHPSIGTHGQAEGRAHVESSRIGRRRSGSPLAEFQAAASREQGEEEEANHHGGQTRVSEG